MAVRKCDRVGCNHLDDDLTKVEAPHLFDRGGVRWYCPPCLALFMEQAKMQGAKWPRLRRPAMTVSLWIPRQ